MVLLVPFTTESESFTKIEEKKRKQEDSAAGGKRKTERKRTVKTKFSNHTVKRALMY